jgi:Na+-translocating ferredoxin:NAD+ oxidoreductase RNF subunit RnfB
MVMFVLRALAAVSMVAFLSATAVGCGSGLSKEDADIRCDQEKAALGFSDAVYKSCEDCFMKCGDECVRMATSPISYECGDTSSTDTGSNTTTDTSTSTM